MVGESVADVLGGIFFALILGVEVEEFVLEAAGAMGWFADAFLVTTMTQSGFRNGEFLILRC